MDMKCIICLKAVGDSWEEGGPNKAVIWETSGNYGSTLLDCEPEKMLLAICDSCVVERGDMIAAFTDPNRNRRHEPLRLYGSLTDKLAKDKAYAESLGDFKPEVSDEEVR